MTFPTALDTTNPVNSEAVSLGASRIRNLANAVQERLASLAVDVNVNPLQLKPGAIPSGYALTSPAITTPTVTGAASFGATVTVTAGGLAVTGNSTITGTLGGLTGLTVASGGATINGNSTVNGTLTATTFSGSAASLTNIPAANITGTLPAISGANLINLNASQLTSGTLPNARLNINISGLNSVSSTSFTGPGTNNATLTLQDGVPAILDVPASNDFRITNNGSPNGWSITGPAGTSAYNSGQDDLFLVATSNGTMYYIRMERWT